MQPLRYMYGATKLLTPVNLRGSSHHRLASLAFNERAQQQNSALYMTELRSNWPRVLYEASSDSALGTHGPSKMRGKFMTRPTQAPFAGHNAQ